MSLNTIKLSPRLTADLYKHTLIEAGTNKIAESYKFLGNNKKKILILAKKPDIAFIEDRELQFLSSVLSACKLSIADIAILNVTGLEDGTAYTSLLHYFDCRLMLLFDVDAQSIDLPFNFPHFQLQQFDQTTYLSAPSLTEIENEKMLKTKLWNCLKALFNI